MYHQQSSLFNLFKMTKFGYHHNATTNSKEVLMIPVLIHFFLRTIRHTKIHLWRIIYIENRKTGYVLSIESGTKEERKCKKTVKYIDNPKTIQRLIHHARERDTVCTTYFYVNAVTKKGNMTESWKRDFQAICETFHSTAYQKFLLAL